VQGETEKRLVAQLLTLLDGLEPRQNLVVIAATNRPEAIDEALRRPGRFDREIVIGVPDERGRREILAIHTRGMPLDGGVNLAELARRTYGFVGADLAALTREAAIEAVRTIMPKINLEEGTIPPEVLDNLSVTGSDFDEALKRVQPSAMREVMVQAPTIGWDDIGGVDAAREAEANFIATKSSDLLSKWYGESEQQIARLFARARQVAPTVIFIDELDSLVPARGGGLGEPQVTERVVNTILAEMDGLEELGSVVVIGATNRPNLIDPALLRPGRFDELIYVSVPDEGGRRHILGIHTKKMPLAEDVDLDSLAARTDRFTGADLEDLVRRSGLFALRNSLEAVQVTMADFEKGLEETRASVTPEMEKDYEKIQESLKRDAMSSNPGGIGFISPGMLTPRGPKGID
jgi:transitional endoplasmic reticulum ATPase